MNTQHPGAQFPVQAPLPPPKPKVAKGTTIFVGVVSFMLGIGFGGMSNDSEASTPAQQSAPTAASATHAAVPSRVTAGGVRATSAVEPEPAPVVEGIGGGEWMVGVEVEPGTYRSPGAVAGFFELCSASTRAANGNVIDWKTGNKDEPVLIKITSDAETFSNSGCEPFVKVK